VTPTKTDEVLAAAHRDLQAQLLVVRSELERLTTEERALTEALSSLNGRATRSSAPSPAGPTRTRSRAAKGSARRGSAAKSRTSRRRSRAPSRSTAERVEELQALLADGPKSRNDLAAGLAVSPARVQQLLSELGSSVSSRPDPGQRQGKLWRLEGARNGASQSKSAPKRGTGKASARKPSAGKPAASK